jgi:hypothetical protein
MAEAGPLLLAEHTPRQHERGPLSWNLRGIPSLFHREIRTTRMTCGHLFTVGVRTIRTPVPDPGHWPFGFERDLVIWLRLSRHSSSPGMALCA